MIEPGRERSSIWRTVSGFVALMVVVGVLTGCSRGSTAPGVAPAVVPAVASGFVTSSGQQLLIDGQPFRFTGFNLYDAAASDFYSCSPSTRLDDAGLDEAMATIRASGGTVVRFWAYQPYTAGGTDFSGVDRVIDAARRHGLRVLPTLEDGPGNCSTGEPALQISLSGDGTWYSQGYLHPYGSASMSYRDYAGLMARHYRDEPTIMAWSLMNEAETIERDSSGRSALVDFADDVSTVVHLADPHHLVTLGTQSNGAPGASGGDFTAIYALPGMDLAEVHDWAFWGSDLEAMPGAEPDGRLPGAAECDRDRRAQLACSFAIAQQLRKPIIVGEAGMRARSSKPRTRRADLFTAKVDAAFRANASGYLIWQLNVANTDGYGVRIASRDPLYDVLQKASSQWSTMGGPDAAGP